MRDELLGFGWKLENDASKARGIKKMIARTLKAMNADFPGSTQCGLPVEHFTRTTMRIFMNGRKKTVQRRETKREKSGQKKRRY
jgi:hypothetical protein